MKLKDYIFLIIITPVTIYGLTLIVPRYMPNATEEAEYKLELNRLEQELTKNLLCLRTDYYYKRHAKPDPESEPFSSRDPLAFRVNSSSEKLWKFEAIGNNKPEWKYYPHTRWRERLIAVSDIKDGPPLIIIQRWDLSAEVFFTFADRGKFSCEFGSDEQMQPYTDIVVKEYEERIKNRIPNQF